MRYHREAGPARSLSRHSVPARPRSDQREHIARVDQPLLPVVIDRETRYLDLDGDGVPDAVEVIETVANRGESPGGIADVQVVRTVAVGIGDDGTPARLLRSVTPSVRTAANPT